MQSNFVVNVNMFVIARVVANNQQMLTNMEFEVLVLSFKC